MSPKSLLDIFVITRHTCHNRWIYLFFSIIINVLRLFLRCTITPFIETNGLSSFFVIFRWFWVFGNRWSTYLHLKYLWGVHSVCCLSKSPVALDISLYFIILKKYSLQNCYFLQKSAFSLKNICSLIFSTRTWTVVIFKQ